MFLPHKLWHMRVIEPIRWSESQEDFTDLNLQNPESHIWPSSVVSLRYIFVSRTSDKWCTALDISDQHSWSKTLFREMQTSGVRVCDFFLSNPEISRNVSRPTSLVTLSPAEHDNKDQKGASGALHLAFNLELTQTPGTNSVWTISLRCM